MKQISCRQDKWSICYELSCQVVLGDIWFSALLSDLAEYIQLYCYIHCNKKRKKNHLHLQKQLSCAVLVRILLSVVVFPTHRSYPYHKNSENLLQGVWPIQSRSRWTCPLVLLALVSSLYFVKDIVKLTSSVPRESAACLSSGACQAR